MDCKQIRFSRHAVERSFERGILPDHVVQAIAIGEVIETYPEDEPYPSVLVLGYIKGQPIHVVVAIDVATGICIVVTVYHPDPSIWAEDFKRRR